MNLQGFEDVIFFSFCMTTHKTCIDFFTAVRTSSPVHNFSVIVAKGKMIGGD
jgi:hypothetical protein